MKRLILTIATLLLLPGSLLADGLGVSLGHDLDSLWKKAQSEYDLMVEDAVILLESQQVQFAADNSKSTRIHRLVWIGTTVGIHSYADLRIPWNTATSNLEVEVLRTWRDGRWWPDEKNISETAVVHTLPHRLDKADDYTTMRETMLLHDGVELGCIMETAYIITEKNTPAAGAVFVLPQHDPTVLTELKVTGKNLIHQELNGAAQPEVIDAGLHWQAELTPALRQPIAASRELYEPSVVWSTWENWGQLADHWMAAYSSEMKLDDDQIQNLKVELHPALGTRQKLVAVGDYLNEMVRSIHYDHGFWRGNPRSASRTLATAYGHDLDRAILAGAFLAEAGFTAEPMLVGRGQTLVAPEIPRLQDLQRIVLRIPSVEDVVLDPSSGHLLSFDEIFGHPNWSLVNDHETGPRNSVLSQSENSLTLAVSLEKSEEDFWQGSGHFQGKGRFSQHGPFLSDADFKEGYLSRLTNSLIAGLKPSAASPGKLETTWVEIDMEFEKFELSKDSLERKVLVLGKPDGGILSQLPAGGHLYDESRQTPVMGIGNWNQTVILRIEVGDEDLLQTPESFSLANEAGSFEMEVAFENGWLVLTRTLQIAEEATAASNWPQLRALLLKESDPAFGTVIWKK